MNLLALLFALVLGRYFLSIKVIKNNKWFFVWQDWMNHQIHEYGVRYFCTVIIPAVFIAGLFWWMDDFLWGLLSFLGHVLLLFYALDRYALKETLEHYLSDWRSQDTEGALLYATQNLNVDATSIENSMDLHHQVRCQTVYFGFLNFFSIVFWYVCLGLAGALWVVLTQQYIARATGENRHWAQQPLFLIEWIPARLLGITFAVAGNFVTGFAYWFEGAQQSRLETREFLTECALQAIGLTEIVDLDDSRHPSRDGLHRAEQEVRTLFALLERSRYVWLSIFALAVILSPSLLA